MRNRFIDTIYRLQNLKRFNNRNVIVYHSPAEHSFYVALLCLYIAKHENIKKDRPYKYDLGLLLEKALHHDLPEAETGDVLHPVKHWSDDIHKKIVEIEEIVVKEKFLKYLPVDLQDSYSESILGCKDGKEGELVALCDQLEVLYYITEERKLGNRSHWIDDVFALVKRGCEEQSKINATARRLYEHVAEEFDKYNVAVDKNI